MPTHTILAVDDNRTNLETLKMYLAKDYTLLLARSGEIALKFLEKRAVDLILLDLVMPGLGGKDTLLEVRRRYPQAHIPVMFLTASADSRDESECLRLGACDFIPKPVVPEVLLSRIQRTLELEDYRKTLQRRLQEKTVEVEKLALQSITTIANALDAKDVHSMGHSVRVAEYADKLARKLGWTAERCERLRRLALLHDVGKLGVPDAILNKPSRLTDEEFLQVKEHCNVGATILRNITSMPYLASGARFHHERYDGHGYPQGLKGNEIPEEARVLCIVNAYDAMTSSRCYRPSLPSSRAREEILLNAGTQFDPDMSRVFVQMLDDGEIVAQSGAKAGTESSRGQDGKPAEEVKSVQQG